MWRELCASNYEQIHFLVFDSPHLTLFHTNASLQRQFIILYGYLMLISALSRLPSPCPSCSSRSFGKKSGAPSHRPDSIWTRTPRDGPSCHWGQKGQCYTGSQQLHAVWKWIQRCHHEKGNGQISWYSSIESETSQGGAHQRQQRWMLTQNHCKIWYSEYDSTDMHWFQVTVRMSLTSKRERKQPWSIPG